MRATGLLLASLLAGCSAVTEAEPGPRAGKGEEAPADLRTRKTGDDWPGFLGPAGDGSSREKGIVTKWAAGGPKVVWTRAVGEGYAAPSVSRGRLFHFDRVRNRCRLACCRAETGEELWTFDYPTDYRDQYNYNGGPRCCPVIDGGRVYLFGPEGMLHCVRVGDGKPVWKVDTRAEFGVVQNFFGVGSTPVVEGDLLLVAVGGSPKGSGEVAFEDLKSNGTGLVAFDKFTGKVRWKAGDELAGYASPVVRTFGKKRIALLFARGGLLGVDVAGGKVDFHHPWRAGMLESVNASNPLVVGNRVLISECYQRGGALLEVRPGGCKTVWSDDGKPARRKSLMCHWMTPVEADGYVYGSSGRHSGEAQLRCVELATGKVLWREPGLNRCSLLRIDGHLLCLGEEGTLRLLRINPKRYDEVAAAVLRRPGAGGKLDPDGEPLLEYPCWAAPIVANGLCYVRGERRLVCLELIPAKGK